MQVRCKTKQTSRRS